MVAINYQVGDHELKLGFLGEGLVTAEGLKWEEQRQFYMKSFRTFGIGRAETERSLQDEIQIQLQLWEKLKGVPFELDGCNVAYVFNAVWSVVASKRLERDRVLNVLHQAAKYDCL